MVKLNRYVIARGESSGLFAGKITKRKGREVELQNCRFLWYWEGATTISQIAIEGVKKPDRCKFAGEVEQIYLTDVIEILPCTKEAEENIKAVPVWASENS